jgi:enamine deaminase RidA (YjgF/YER057c/UK114 family)
MSPDPPARVINVHPPELAPARGFSHATVAAGLVWLGGQIASDAHGNVQMRGDIGAQFRVAIRNVSTALVACGSAPSDVVKITYYVTDVPAYRGALKTIGEAYREVFGRHYPATTLVGVQALFHPEALVEIECVALAPEVKPGG